MTPEIPSEESLRLWLLNPSDLATLQKAMDLQIDALITGVDQDEIWRELWRKSLPRYRDENVGKENVG